MTLADGVRVKVAANVHCRWFHEELVILDIDRGEYFAVDEVGGHLWEEIARGLPLREAIDRVAVDYDVGLERFRQDAEGFIGELLRRGLVVPVVGTSREPPPGSPGSL